MAKKRIFAFLFLFILTAVLTVALIGCNDKGEEGQDSPAEEATEVRYSSEKGDVLVLQNGNFTLTLADNRGTYEGKYSGQGKALVLSTAEGDRYVTLDGGSLFSLIEMNGSGEIVPVKPAQGCKHERTVVTGVVAPDCEKAGFSGNEVCLDCGTIVTPGAEMRALGHNYTEESDVVCLKGNCTRNETHYYSCSVCGKISSNPNDTYEIPNSASGQHSFTEISDEICEEATCAHDRVCYAACSVCGEISDTVQLSVPNTKTNDHDFSVRSTKKLYSEPDCGHNARYFYACSVCGQVSLDPNDTYEVEGTVTGTHSFTQPSGHVKCEATCVSDRVDYARCAVCGLVDETKEVVVPNTATGVHVYTALSDVVAQRATCTTDRYVYSQCKFCGKLNRQQTLRVIATATDHTYVDHVCTDCGAADPNFYAMYDVSADKNTDHVYAYLYRSGLVFDLLIVGNGNSESYVAAADAPWAGENIVNAFVYGNVAKLGDYTFSGLTALTSVKIVSSVERFGNYAFYGCDSLQTLVLPMSTERLGVGAFAHCPALRSVNMSALASLSYVGNNLFRGDTSLQSIDLSGTALTALSQEMFSECTVLQNVVLPAGLTTVGDYAFYCTAIGSVSLPASTEKIGVRAFSDCTYLTAIDLTGTALKTIGDYAFAGADLLASFSIGSGVTEIGKGILDGTTYYYDAASWTGGLMYGDTVTGGFHSKEYLLGALSEDIYFKVTTHDGDNPAQEGWYKKVESDDYYPSTDVFCRGGAEYYEYLSGESKYVRVEGHIGDVPYGVWFQQRTVYVEATETACGSTEYYKKVSPVSGSLTLPAATKVIADGAMEDCLNVTAINLSGAQYVGKDAFRHCMALASVQMDNAKVIGESAFYSCAKLTSVTLPSSVVTVKGLAFAKCGALRSFSYRSGATLASDALEGDNLFEVYRPTTSADSFGAVVIHTAAYAERSTVVIDDNGFVFARYDNGVWALVGCQEPDKTSLVLPDSFTYLGETITSYRIHDKAFCYDGYYAQFATVALSSAVTAIGKEAFLGCDNLLTVSVPLSVTEIGEDAFRDTAFYNDESNWQNGFLYLEAASGERFFLLTVRPGLGVRLASAVVKENTVVIADNAFALCSETTALTLPATLTSVGKDLLVGCTRLSSLTVPFVGKTSDPDGENSFIAYFFGGESYADNASVLPESLVSLTVTTATALPAYALYSCAGLKTIVLSRVNTYRACALYGCVNANVTVSSEIVSVGEYAFYNCIGLGAVNFATSITSIADYAFYHTGLRQIAVSANTATVGEYAFAESPYLYKATLGMKNGSELRYVGAGAFQNCINLVLVTLGNAMVATGEHVGIQNNAFFGCKKLVDVLNYSSLDVSYSSTDYGYLGYYAKTIRRVETGGIKEDGDFCWGNFSGEGNFLLAYIGTGTEIALPDNTITNYKIYSYAFANNPRIKKVVMPSVVVGIGQYAFMDCVSLTDVSISSSVGNVEKGAFARSGLTGVSLPSSVRVIAESAFEDCASLTAVAFNSGLETIDRYAFRNCVALSSIALSASVTSIGEEAFSGCSSARTLTVRQNVTSVGAKAFSGCVMLNRINWDSFIQPNINSKLFENAGKDSFGITAYFTASVPNYFFDTDSVLTAPKVVEVSLGSAVTSIGTYAFRNLPFTSIDLPEGLTTIGDFAFEKAALTSVVLPDTVLVVGSGVFNACSALRNVTLSAGMTSVPAGLLQGCTSIVSIFLPGSIATIGENAFSGCVALKYVAVCSALTAVGNNAFAGCTNLYYDGETTVGCLFVVNASSFTATVGTGNEALSSAQKRFVYFDEANFSLYNGSNDKNALNFKLASGGLYDPYAISYSSSNEGVVGVNSSTGYLVGNAFGSAVITATIELVSGLVVKYSYSVTVI